MNSEISFGGKIYNFLSLYLSPSQSSDTFTDNLELNLDKIAKLIFLVVLGDFNVKSSNWYKHDEKLMKVLKLMK